MFGELGFAFCLIHLKLVNIPSLVDMDFVGCTNWSGYYIYEGVLERMIDESAAFWEFLVSR
jgi:hypothetical protein